MQTARSTPAGTVEMSIWKTPESVAVSANSLPPKNRGKISLLLWRNCEVTVSSIPVKMVRTGVADCHAEMPSDSTDRAMVTPSSLEYPRPIHGSASGVDRSEGAAVPTGATYTSPVPATLTSDEASAILFLLVGFWA